MMVAAYGGSFDLLLGHRTSGSSTLTSALLEHGLADEVNLIVYPALLGKGKRLLAEGTPPRALALDSSNALQSGLVVNSHKAAGPLQNHR